MASILLVEDDPSVREAVGLALKAAGHRVTTAASGDEAVESWRQWRPELILLDLMLPGIDGFEVCRRVRRDDQVPIIMITARSDPYDIVVGLESGADDYVVKPFETRVLLARITAVLRRERKDPASSVLRAGPVTIDPQSMTVTTAAGSAINLTRTEFRLLLELARHPGQVFTRDVLLQRVWDYSYLGDSRLVDVCVQRLRAKLSAGSGSEADELIRTVRGVGYKLVDP